jgi:hypothetical protein
LIVVIVANSSLAKTRRSLLHRAAFFGFLEIPACRFPAVTVFPRSSGAYPHRLRTMKGAWSPYLPGRANFRLASYLQLTGHRVSVSSTSMSRAAISRAMKEHGNCNFVTLIQRRRRQQQQQQQQYRLSFIREKLHPRFTATLIITRLSSLNAKPIVNLAKDSLR